jgi:phosphate transport system substrate-binding protein
MALVGHSLGCGGAGDSLTPPAATTCAGIERRFEGVVVAGSGSALPIAAAMAQAYTEAIPSARFWVPESIGTSGAIRALKDGVIDVGLATRPLNDKERAGGLRVTTVARSVLAIVLHPSVGVRSLSTAELEALYRGERTRWPNGAEVTLLVREPGDSGDRVLSIHRPGLLAAMLEARESGRAIELHTDQEMRDALLAIEGAVGVLDLAVVRLEELPLQPIELDGVSATPDAAVRGDYPLVRELSLVTRVPEPPGTTLRPEIEAFVDFWRSEPGRAVLKRAGYILPDGAAP